MQITLQKTSLKRPQLLLAIPAASCYSESTSREFKVCNDSQGAALSAFLNFLPGKTPVFH